MKTKFGIFAGLIVLVAMIGMSPSFADSNTTVISTNDGIQLTKTVVPMIISSDNTKRNRSTLFVFSLKKSANLFQIYLFFSYSSSSELDSGLGLSVSLSGLT